MGKGFEGSDIERFVLAPSFFRLSDNPVMETSMRVFALPSAGHFS